MKESVVLGLSGGVDSAVAASLLGRDYDVHCVYLDIGGGDAARRDASEVAAALRLPFSVRSIGEPLEKHVCAPFAAAYSQGRTPLPCALCNPLVKFPALFAAADEMGASFVATGHYARIQRDDAGRCALRQGKTKNDQAYLLARLPEKMLPRILFPLGIYEKPQVREMAKALGLSVSQKPDSMDICFVPDGDYAGWMARRGPVPPPGDFVDAAGHVLGRHKGIHHYTLGQRRGLGIAMGRRVFVSRIDPLQNEITLSGGDGLMAERVLCADPNWIGIDPPSGPMAVTVKLRHTKRALDAVITCRGDTVEIALKTKARAPTPGQMAVFYIDDRIIGSGWISSSSLHDDEMEVLS
ncbi:MAG: tRNA 2-thiouridine(34) synthase MnmA [Oscillospiraceae bacterium]|jgi:tRNA-specific 2-thiouridylase